MDIAGPKTDEVGKQFYVLVAVDYHNRYVIANTYDKPIVSRYIIDFLSKIFYTFGYCDNWEWQYFYFDGIYFVTLMQ